ncbi:MAG: hypothetical protein R3300_19135 [Candidatus Promineifilaceae bacterium]|nr:hypothetical protein [Candidatus Promineifilaceae bacterium]
MSNPFTQHLLAEVSDEELIAFIRHWDRLERLIIAVYRSGAAEPGDQTEYEAVWSWLRAAYPRWAAELEPHWRGARAAGQKLTEDPFLRLLSSSAAANYVGDWKAMQYLPAAREAINGYLIQLR